MPTRTKSEAGTRPDAEIAREVTRRMKEDIDVPDDRITVKVADGVVTIAGIVNHAAQKDATERCAARVKGVRGITNKIEVGLAPPF
ncbi:MAG: BON domain-containing protein [Acidobacteriia bacterium]|nr:BON domain-containing protein [Terriglobia bacterium]